MPGGKFRTIKKEGDLVLDQLNVGGKKSSMEEEIPISSIIREKRGRVGK